ncbi:hypothetical protein hrd7_14970 [Leptolinea sp. HRD-7]|nr:hypothetical protein hrd7_14970 [Leptolinea sp. HRD-7]
MDGKVRRLRLHLPRKFKDVFFTIVNIPLYAAGDASGKMPIRGPGVSARMQRPYRKDPYSMVGLMQAAQVNGWEG